MASRIALALALGLGVVSVGAAAARPARSEYTERNVLRAFHLAGISLYDTQQGEGFAVTSLADTEPRHRGWSLGVFIYPSVRTAAAAYAGGAARWRASGFASARVENVLITVVPDGRTLAKKAAPFPMPSVIRSALAQLAG